MQRFFVMLFALCLLQLPDSSANQDQLSQEMIDVSGTGKKATEITAIGRITQVCRQITMQKLQATGQPITSDDFEKAKDLCVKEKMQDPNLNARELVKEFGKENIEAMDNIAIQSSGEYAKLRDFLSKRLTEALYGVTEKNKERSKVADHQIFYDLYKTQLGKNVIAAISEYCLFADDRGIISANPKERTKTRNRNLEALTVMDQAVPTPAASSQGASAASGNLMKENQAAANIGNQNAAFRHFQSCLPQITHICERTNVEYRLTDGTTGMTRYEDDRWLLGLPSDKTPSNEEQADLRYTRDQACITNRNLKQLRSALLQMRNIEGEMKKFQADPSRKSVDQQMALYNRGATQGEKGVDDLTSLTSGEFSSTAGGEMYGRAVKFERNCLNAPSAQCYQMLNDNQDYKAFLKMKDEYNARTQLMKKRLLVMTPDELKKFFEAEGRTPQEVALVMQKVAQATQQNAPNGTPTPTPTTGPNNAIQAKIADIYEQERNAVINKMSERMNLYNLQMGNKNSPLNLDANASVNSPEMAKAAREKILSELNSRQTNLESVLHYNNIISGFLTVEDAKSGKVKTNVATAKREMADSWYDIKKNSYMGNPQAKSWYGVDASHYQKLQAITTQKMQALQGQNSDASTLEVETLNANIIGNYMDKDLKTQQQLDQQDMARRQQKQTATPK